MLQGAVQNTYAYAPYRFGGAYGACTGNTGLFKISRRHYDPTLGRWTSRIRSLAQGQAR
ncbi:MAG TPA: hypothetical protein VFS96_08610 [Nitrolancea sp.]|nr:hypothetical protein [Nitrolancea sp.]